MSREHYRFRVYTVNQCGYYKRGQSDPEFGELRTTLEQLKTWIEDKNLKDTKTYGWYEDVNVEPTYCRKALSKGDDDYFLAMWNEVSSTENATASIQGDKLATEAKVKLQGFPPGNIPGYPAFFWFIPSKCRLITVQPKGAKTNGLEQLRKYISNYLLFWSPFSIKEANVESKQYQLVGYTPDESQMPPDLSLVPRFDTFLYDRNQNNVELVRRQLNEVRKLCRKIEIDLSEQYDVDFIEKIFDLVGLREVPKIDNTFRMLYELDFDSPTLEQFESIISEWKRKARSENNAWEDIGFRLESNRERVLWLKRFYISKEFSLAVKKDNGAATPESIFASILLRRSEFISSLMI